MQIIIAEIDYMRYLIQVWSWELCHMSADSRYEQSKTVNIFLCTYTYSYHSADSA